MKVAAHKLLKYSIVNVYSSSDWGYSLLINANNDVYLLVEGEVTPGFKFTRDITRLRITDHCDKLPQEVQSAVISVMF